MTGPSLTGAAAQPLDPDRTEAERFIATLVGSADAAITFQTFHDTRKGELASILHGTLAQHWHELVRLNRAGAGVFLMVNEGDGQGRKAANVRKLRALFGDDDQGDLTPTALEVTPSIIVQSRRGIHPYWKLRAGEPLDRFTAAQVALAKAIGTVPDEVKDLPRVMRLPGFFHRKKSDPFLVRVLQTSEASYSINEVLEGFGCRPAPIPPRKPVQTNGHDRGYGAGALRHAAARILEEPEGGRNKKLNREAFGIGQLVGGGVIPRASAEATLEGAGLDAGLTISETRTTVRSGLNAGEKEPRGVPKGQKQEEPPPPTEENPPGPGAQAKRPYLTHVLTRMSTVQSKPVHWLWKGRIAFGKLTMLEGDPGNGKSTIALDLAARLTTGRPMPGEDVPPCGPARVLLVSVEDDAGDTLRPRLEAAGADLTLVEILTIQAGGKELLPVLSDHLPQVEAALLETGAKLLILDPLAAMMGRANMWKDQEVREVLGPLNPVLERTMAATLPIRHLNKGHGGGSALYAGGGSIGISGAARSVLCVGRNPQDPVQRVLALTKSNNAEVYRVPSLAYRIEQVMLGEIETTRIKWEGVSPYTADELLATQIPQSHEDRSAMDEAKAFLLEVLAGGPIPSKDLERQAKEAGISVPTLKRARDRLGVRAQRKPDGKWLVSFPAHSTSDPLDPLDPEDP